jgi:hypothetical protein
MLTLVLFRRDLSVERVYACFGVSDADVLWLDNRRAYGSAVLRDANGTTIKVY